MASAQKANEIKYTIGVACVQGTKKTQSLISNQISTEANPLVYVFNKGNRGTSSEQVKTLAVSDPKSKATTSSRTNKCVMA